MLSKIDFKWDLISNVISWKVNDVQWSLLGNPEGVPHKRPPALWAQGTDETLAWFGIMHLISHTVLLLRMGGRSHPTHQLTPQARHGTPLDNSPSSRSASGHNQSPLLKYPGTSTPQSPHPQQQMNPEHSWVPVHRTYGASVLSGYQSGGLHLKLQIGQQKESSRGPEAAAGGAREEGESPLRDGIPIA